LYYIKEELTHWKEVKRPGVLAAPGPKRPKPTKKNPEKHLENPPKMPAL